MAEAVFHIGCLVFSTEADKSVLQNVLIIKSDVSVLRSHIWVTSIETGKKCLICIALYASQPVSQCRKKDNILWQSLVEQFAEVIRRLIYLANLVLKVFIRCELYKESSSGEVVRSTGAYKRLGRHPAGPVLGWVARVEYPVPKHYTYQAVRSGFRVSISWLSIVVRMRRKIEVPPT